LFITFDMLQEKASFKKTAVSASATVIGFKKERVGRPGRQTSKYFPLVQFIDQRGRTLKRYSRSRVWPYKRGKTVTVLYQLDTSKSVVIDDWQNSMNSAFILIFMGGFGLWSIAAALLVFMRIFISRFWL